MSLINVWRITDKKYADTAFSGEGARLWGGRFNSPGTRAVYTSGSLSLTLLEILVQTNDRSDLKKKVLFRADIPEKLIENRSLNHFPEQWNCIPVSMVSQLYGDEWINNNNFPVLRVPSVVVPQEINYIINPLHKQFKEISISEALSIPLDSRFFGG